MSMCMVLDLNIFINLMVDTCGRSHELTISQTISESGSPLTQYPHGSLQN